MCIRDRAEAACWEADTNYPVPRRMTQDDCEKLLRAILPEAPQVKPAAPKKKVAVKAKQTARKSAARTTVKPSGRRSARAQ